MNSYDAGDLIQPFVEFRDAAGALADPTTVSCRVTKPSGAVVVYSLGGNPPVVDDTGLGAFHVDVTPGDTEYGIWYYRFVGTGAVQDSAQGAFNVRQPRAV